MSDVLFSIVIACFNQQEFVKQTVESAISQACTSKEVVVVDDASSDGTETVLRGFGNAINYIRLDTNGGASAARNRGAAAAKGKYLVFLDGDDVLTPWTLEVYKRLIDDHAPKIILAKCTFCYNGIPSVTKTDSPREACFVKYPDFLSKDRPWVYNSSSLVVLRQAFEEVGGWTPDFFFQDIQDLLNKLGVAGTTALVLSPSTVWYRMHSANATWKVQSFVDGIYRLTARAKAGVYAGGPAYATRRAAWFGGLAFYWAKEALKLRYYRATLGLVYSNGWRIALAIARRLWVVMTGRRAQECVALNDD